MFQQRTRQSIWPFEIALVVAQLLPGKAPGQLADQEPVAPYQLQIFPVDIDIVFVNEDVGSFMMNFRPE